MSNETWDLIKIGDDDTALWKKRYTKIPTYEIVRWEKKIDHKEKL